MISTNHLDISRTRLSHYLSSLPKKLSNGTETTNNAKRVGDTTNAGNSIHRVADKRFRYLLVIFNTVSSADASRSQ